MQAQQQTNEQTADGLVVPPSPEALMDAFVSKLEALAHGGQTVASNPAYVFFTAKDFAKQIEQIIGLAKQYHEDGYENAADVAKSYRYVFTLFDAMYELGKDKKFKDLHTLLTLAKEFSLSDAALIASVRRKIKDPAALAELDATPPDLLRAHLLERELDTHPALSSQLQFSAVRFDQLIFKNGLYSFTEQVGNARSNYYGSFVDQLNSGSNISIGAGSAITYLGLISPELGLAVGALGSIVAGGILTLGKLPELSEKQFAELSRGLSRIADTVQALEAKAVAAEQGVGR